MCRGYYLTQPFRARAEKLAVIFRGLGMIGMCVVAVAACAPDTGLDDERRAPLPLSDAGPGAARDGGARAGGPMFLLVQPSADVPAVPTNLASVLVRAPQGVRMDEYSLRLVADSPPGATVLLDCPSMVAGEGSGTSWEFPLSQPLHGGTGYMVQAIAVPASVDGGAAAVPITVGYFITGSSTDNMPPEAANVQIETAAGCVHARLGSSEPAAVSVILAPMGMEGEYKLPAGRGGNLFDITLRVPASGPSGDVMAAIELVDWAGNKTRSPGLPLKLPKSPLRLAITEVLANPAGSEYTQEFVELHNFGSEPVSLAGFQIEDAGGGDKLPGETIAPGGYALVVAAAYDPADPSDPAPRAGTTIVKIEGRIGRDGLSNSGEAVRLRGPDGEIVSLYGGWVDVSATAWSGRSVRRTAIDACDEAAAWTHEPSQPTPGW